MDVFILYFGIVLFDHGSSNKVPNVRFGKFAYLLAQRHALESQLSSGHHYYALKVFRFLVDLVKEGN